MLQLIVGLVCWFIVGGILFGGCMVAYDVKELPYNTDSKYEKLFNKIAIAFVIYLLVTIAGLTYLTIKLIFFGD